MDGDIRSDKFLFLAEANAHCLFETCRERRAEQAGHCEAWSSGPSRVIPAQYDLLADIVVHQLHAQFLVLRIVHKEREVLAEHGVRSVPHDARLLLLLVPHRDPAERVRGGVGYTARP